MLITKPDIVGARITDLHSSSSEDLDDLDFTRVYFTVDRGFSFELPTPGYEWETIVVPPAAECLPDEYLSWSYNVKRGRLFGLRITPETPTKVDLIKRMKERTIQGVSCWKLDEELGFYPPDSSLLLFDDGSQAYCVTVCQHGTGQSGLHYLTDVD